MYNGDYNGQAEQDKYVLNILKGKENGYFLEIGSSDPFYINNTFILEKLFNWTGIMIDNSNEWLDTYKLIRQNSKYIIEDATKIDYKKILKDSPKNIDYLQIDIEASNGSTIKTLEKLNNEIMDNYKFAVITFEHDLWLAKCKYTRERSREIFKNQGYICVFEDINNNNPNIVYEDWYVYPDLVDMEYINKLKELNINNYKKNKVTNLSINYKDIIYPDNIQFKDKIIIGNSETQTKIITLDKIYPSNTKLLFAHKYKDIFSYIFNDNKLIITRMDENYGWGQHLIGYI